MKLGSEPNNYRCVACSGNGLLREGWDRMALDPEEGSVVQKGHSHLLSVHFCALFIVQALKTVLHV